MDFINGRSSSNSLAAEPLISWDCEGRCYSDARATETEPDPLLSLVCCDEFASLLS